MLNIIWASFFIIPFLFALYQSFVLGNTQIWTELVSSTFSSSKDAFYICINLTGILCLWLGILKIAENSGITNLLAKALSPFFTKVMPDVPKNHASIGSIVMNMAANMLGLDNAATPFGLKAMEQLQDLNKKKDTATNAQILFMVLNSSGVTIIPITILMYRSELGSLNPSSVFVPILLATSVSTLFGFLLVSYVQKLNIFNRIVMGYLLGIGGLIAFIACFFANLSPEARLKYSADIGNFILFAVIIAFIITGLIKKINVYDTFITGAKEGFDVAVRIIPYLVAMLVAIAVLRTSGVLDLITLGLEKFILLFTSNADFVAALPTAIMKPLSGSGARAMMIETMQTYGADSFQGFASSVVQGSTETTFYVLAVYFGVVRITKIRHALACSLLADLVGIIAAIYFAYLFY